MYSFESLLNTLLTYFIIVQIGISLFWLVVSPCFLTELLQVWHILRKSGVHLRWIGLRSKFRVVVLKGRLPFFVVSFTLKFDKCILLDHLTPQIFFLSVG